MVTLVVSLLLFQSVLAATDDRSVAVVEKNRDSRKRVALVIGNSSYSSSPLKNPTNDAHVMAVSLRRLGFEVEEKTNLGYMEMNKAVESFGKKLRSGGVGLFYYAGHGMQVGGANYLIPIDAQIEDENEVRFKAVDAGLVLAKMEQAKSDVNLVVLDACRDNPFSRSFRSTSHGLASMDAPNGTFIAYATAPGKTAADGDGKNGLYTAELVKVLETPGIPLEQVFKRTLKAVREKSGSKQTPWVASNLEGEFYFIQPSSMTDLQPSPLQPVSPVIPAVSDPMPSVDTQHADPLKDSVTGIELVDVPKGCFSANGKQTCLDEFRIGKFDVTQRQYQRIMGSNPSHFSSCGADCPVESVSWDDAQSFISKLNSQTGKHYRLPTEAEWEYACRSGGKNEEYCGGNDVGAVAWYYNNSGSKTHPVGQKQANGLGIYDMSGNVWQWVQDWYDSDYPSSGNNPRGASTGSRRVNRGGSWRSGAGHVRAAARSRISSGDRLSFLGFRLASTVQ